MPATHILGIDIAKDKFDVCLRPADAAAPRRAAVFPNHAQGFQALQQWLAQTVIGELHACLEATNRYGEALALHLHQAGHRVSVVNPRRTRRYADSRLVRVQNDHTDAALIADFCASQAPRCWQPLPTGHRQLQELVRTRAFFVGQRQQCRNRLATSGGFSAQLLREQLQQYGTLLVRIKKQITALLKQEPKLARQVELAESISGVGLITAVVAVAELPPLESLEHAGQAVALAGLDLCQKESGTSVHTAPRLSKMGSRLLRQALYMAALTALRCNPPVQALGQRLKAKGKGGKRMVAAAMRKLLRLIYGVIKQDQPFDPDWQARDRAAGLGGRASAGDVAANSQFASPAVATA